MNLATAQQKLLDAGLESRQGQKDMMMLIEKSLRQKKIAVVEGGTGIGKTFGYLIPILLNKPSKTKIIIATATISLQEQLALKDIPKLEKILDVKIKTQIAKGRGRYVCQQKLYHFQDAGSQSELALFGIEEPSKNQQSEQETVNTLISLLEDKTWHGDRDALHFPVKDYLWHKLTTDSVGCSNRHCQFFEDCSFFNARKSLRQAEIIVTNHDLLLADISKGTGVVLPKAEDCIYIIDEAHHFHHKAISHFAASCSTKLTEDWLDKLSKSLLSISNNIEIPPATLQQSENAVTELLSLNKDWQQFLNTNYHLQQKNGIWVIQTTPSGMYDFTQPLLNHSQQLQTSLYHIRKILTEKHNTQILEDFELYLNILSYYTGRCDQMVQTWSLFNRMEQQDQPPVARWIDAKQANKNQPYDFQCFAAMTSASTLLPYYFWQHLSHGAVLCSATLRALGQFDDFLQKTGLMGNDKIVTQYFISPFPYQESKLVIPAMQTEPKGENNEQHAWEVAKLIPGLLSTIKHGALVLFTSRRMMDAVIGELPSDFLQDVLVQSDLPKQKLLDKHFKQIDASGRSIIFGMQSFAEGVDLPGQYCEHVIVTKLPFAVPTTPIEKTRSNWIEQRGQNAFMTHTLPEASMRLTQYVGRLVRSQNDIGQITILDRRVITKSYGKRLLDNLPEFERIIG